VIQDGRKKDLTNMIGIVAFQDKGAVLVAPAVGSKRILLCLLLRFVLIG
jgi:hypothetical protein